MVQTKHPIEASQRSSPARAFPKVEFLHHGDLSYSTRRLFALLHCRGKGDVRRPTPIGPGGLRGSRTRACLQAGRPKRTNLSHGMPSLGSGPSGHLHLEAGDVG
jgi:hypothetical protein